MADLNKDLNDVQRATGIVANNAEHQRTPDMAGYTNVNKVEPKAPDNKPAAGLVTPKKEVPETPKEQTYHIEKENPEAKDGVFGLQDTKIDLVADDRNHGLVLPGSSTVNHMNDLRRGIYKRQKWS